jgi:uncharacterized protein
LHHLKREKLKLVNQYIIPFTGLKEGDHKLIFDFGKEFFESHEVLEAQNGTLTADVVLTKQTSMLKLSIKLSGNIEIQCDRCLEFFQFPIYFKGDLIVKFGEDTSASNDEIWIINPDEVELDLEQYFFECIGLCIPIQRVHPESDDAESACNQSMIDLLHTHMSDSHKKDEPDPRWSKLKDLFNDINTN